MNFFLETLKVLGLLVVYSLEAFLRLFVPVRRKSVEGELVLMTGAGAGLGRSMALEFARLGARLVLWDIDETGNLETARLIKETHGARAHTYTCDCSSREEVKREVGDITILVNNAGIVTGKKFLQSPDSLIEKTMEVNSMAHFWTYKAFLPAMIAANHGHVVSLASSAGLIGVSGLADYCASKFAAVGFAEAIALEMVALGCDGVKTTIVCPFFINTGMFDGANTKWPRIMPILEPDYVCRKIVDAVRRDQVYLYLPRSIYLSIALKNILPVKIGVLLGEYLGAFDFMAKFHGHGKKNN
ncbi:epidermal retinol dehydrogenase 2 isoform X2 [Neoarius graeffei]|uniref:epidermal retinol dehydrogenase 2 isoform X2 n=1 Tax=Neoarius graeffei TaxID=443677 RepID=UPI00298C2D43|nr:epidermal retinol dehydrogenase 2 isoform X2 [Neoarius graeffei]